MGDEARITVKPRVHTATGITPDTVEITSNWTNSLMAPH